MCKSSKAEEIPPPLLGKIWINAYQSIPKWNIPYTHLNVSFAIFCGIGFCMLRILSTIIMIQYYDWPKSSQDTNEAAASVVGFFHSSILLPALVIGFLVHNYSPSEHMSKNMRTDDNYKNWYLTYVDSILQFSTGYFIYDTIFILGNRVDFHNLGSGEVLSQLTADDIMFLGHHFMTTTYMTQARVYQAGHMSAMMCMLLGEASNPLHNMYLVSQIAIRAKLMVEPSVIIETVFAIVYLSFRTCIGPIVCAHMTWDLMTNGPKNGLPFWVVIFWNIMIWAVILGSYSWIVFTYQMLQTHYSGWMEISQEL